MKSILSLSFFLFTLSFSACGFLESDSMESDSQPKESFFWPSGPAQALIVQQGDSIPQKCSAFLSKDEQGYHVALHSSSVDISKEVMRITLLFPSGKRFELNHPTWVSKQPARLQFQGEVQVNVSVPSLRQK